MKNKPPGSEPEAEVFIEQIWRGKKSIIWANSRLFGQIVDSFGSAPHADQHSNRCLRREAQEVNGSLNYRPIWSVGKKSIIWARSRLLLFWDEHTTHN